MVGNKKELREDVLTTKQDILRHHLWLDERSWVEKIAKKVMDIWPYAGIPTLSPRGVTKKLMQLRYEYRNLSKANKNERESTTFIRRTDKFKTDSITLFDIAACKCKEFCSCVEKLPDKLKEFLKDQRTERKMKISSARVGDLADAAIASATLLTFNIVVPSIELEFVINRNKVLRSKTKLRQDLSSQRIQGMFGLYFDGRKDKTMFMKRGTDVIFRQNYKKEEHVSMIAEPGGTYVGHLSLDNGKA